MAQLQEVELIKVCCEIVEQYVLFYFNKLKKGAITPEKSGIYILQLFRKLIYHCSKSFFRLGKLELFKKVFNSICSHNPSNVIVLPEELYLFFAEMAF